MGKMNLAVGRIIWAVGKMISFRSILKSFRRLLNSFSGGTCRNLAAPSLPYSFLTRRLDILRWPEDRSQGRPLSSPFLYRPPHAFASATVCFRAAHLGPAMYR